MGAYLQEIQQKLAEATRHRDSFTAGLPPGQMRGSKQDLELAQATVEKLEQALSIEIGTVDLREFAGALVRAGGDRMVASSQAENAGKHALAYLLRAPVPPATSGDAGWAEPLSEAQNRMSSPVLARLQEESLLGIEGLQQVPFNVPVPTVSTGAGFSWVAENSPKAITRLSLGTVTLPPRKAVSIVVASRELLRLGGTRAEQTLENEITNAVISGVNRAFLDAVAGDAARPKGLLNGVTPINGSNLAKAVEQAIAALPPAGRSALWVASRDARQVVGSLLDVDGTLGGVPVRVQGDLPAGTLVLLIPGLVLFAMEGLIVDIAESASLQMVDNPATGALNLVSLWQQNLVALRCEVFVNWQAAPGVVQVISPVTTA